MGYSELIAKRIRKILGRRPGLVEKKMFGGLAFLVRGKMLIGVLGEKVVARCRPEDQPGLLQPPHVTPMNFTGRVLRGWLYVTGPSTEKVAGLRTWIARAEAAQRAPQRKPERGAR
jgi:hypothetical protein